MKSLVFKNISSTDLVVNDLGIQISPSEDIDLASNFDEEQILLSVDLQPALEAQGQIWLEGTVQLTYSELIDYLTDLNRYDKIDYNYISSKDDTTDVTGAELERLTNNSDVSASSELHHHDTRYYSKIQLQTSGSSSINYSNLINIPNFYWKDPVVNVSNLPIAGSVSGDVRIVTSTKNIYVFDGSLWINICKSVNILIDPILGYSGTTVQSILESIKTEITNIELGTQHVNKSLDDAYGDGSIINVDSTNLEINLSSDKYFSIDSSIDSSSLLSVSNTDVSLSSKGTLSLKDVNMTSSVELSESGHGGLTGFSATSIIGALNELKSSSGGPDVSLQDAYDNGRNVNITNGSINLSYSSYAPLKFENASLPPSLDLQSGQIALIQGDLSIFDPSRSKWLSISEIKYTWSDQTCDGKYMRIGVATDSNTGYLMPKNCTITKISVKIANGSLTKEFQIRKNGLIVKTLNLINGIYYSNSEDIDLSEGDLLQVYCTGVDGPVHDPIFNIYAKWKY